MGHAAASAMCGTYVGHAPFQILCNTHSDHAVTAMIGTLKAS